MTPSLVIMELLLLAMTFPHTVHAAPGLHRGTCSLVQGYTLNPKP